MGVVDVEGTSRDEATRASELALRVLTGEGDAMPADELLARIMSEGNFDRPTVRFALWQLLDTGRVVLDGLMDVKPSQAESGDTTTAA